MTDRYARQIVLPQVGIAGQARLAAARVLVVGAGGLGCPVLQYLAGAGIGRIVVVDHDRVEQSNLHRQPLYTMADIGSLKALAARAALLRFNPTIEVAAVAERLTPANVERLVADADVVVDAADSLAATYILSDACQQIGRPLVSASAVGLSGYVGAFCAGAPSYRAVFPEMPAQAANCASAGVLGSTVAILGSVQAQFVLQLILAIAPTPLGRLVTFEAGRLAFGGFSFDDAPEPAGIVARYIAPAAVTGADFVVDLRGLDEAPVSPFDGARRLTVDTIDTLLADGQPPTGRIVLCCRSGLRAWQAARRLADGGLTDLALVALGDGPA
ncbi:MAG: HesA/MoeB/ThiF family protein [Rhodanobacter sp.]|nr:MAG: HesA/MoeB/ThiF family protein [Rhodanobacter sp.]